MFSKSRSRHNRANFGRPKEDRGGKKHSIRVWLSKRKHKHHDHGVMTSSESVPTFHASLTPPVGIDVPDEASRSGNNSPATTLSVKPLKEEKDTEAIEEEVMINRTTLPTPEPRPKIEKNGCEVDGAIGNFSIDPDRKKQNKNAKEDDDCLISCIYITQQCCECTIS